MNTGYPDAYTDSTSCTYTFKKASLDICYIRLQFVHMVVRGPAVTVSPYTRCTYDKVSEEFLDISVLRSLLLV